jgi:TPP-dependent indolepyruvate ferredoxin oxidoreductase alpha subunit
MNGSLLGIQGSERVADTRAMHSSQNEQTRATTRLATCLPEPRSQQQPRYDREAFDLPNASSSLIPASLRALHARAGVACAPSRAKSPAKADRASAGLHPAFAGTLRMLLAKHDLSTCPQSTR